MNERVLWEAAETTLVAAPMRRVWAVISDIERYPERLRSHLSGSGRISGVRMLGPFRVGTCFELEVNTAELGQFVARNCIDDVAEPNRLAWISFPPRDEGESEDHQIEVHWSFHLTPGLDRSTALQHAVAIPTPVRGADQLLSFLSGPDRHTAIRSTMRETLHNMKDAAEPR